VYIRTYILKVKWICTAPSRETSKVFRHGSHSFTGKLHHVCLYIVSYHWVVITSVKLLWKAYKNSYAIYQMVTFPMTLNESQPLLQGHSIKCHSFWRSNKRGRSGNFVHENSLIHHIIRWETTNKRFLSLRLRVALAFNADVRSHLNGFYKDISTLMINWFDDQHYKSDHAR